jgi:hypothetical protein
LDLSSAQAVDHGCELWKQRSDDTAALRRLVWPL